MITEATWAKGSPKYVKGQRVLAYADDVPCTVIGPDPEQPGYWFVTEDASGRRLSVAWDNLLLPACACGSALPPSQDQCYACETLGGFLRLLV